MTFLEPKRPDYLSAGRMVRLFPTDQSQERRAASVVLASLMSVHEFRTHLLRSIGARCNSRSKIDCFTEISFADDRDDAKADRPDGLILVTTGRNTWRALVEIKVGSEPLKVSQMENYLDIAANHGVDAVITISNEYVSSHAEQPGSLKGVDGRKLRSRQLVHWSWAFLLNEALVWMKEHKDSERNIEDKDQQYILGEFVRFCRDENSGINIKYGRMGKSWQTTCKHFQGSAPCTDAELSEAVSSWQQLVRSLALQLGMLLGEHVEVSLSRSSRRNPELRLSDNIQHIKQQQELSATLLIPHAASPLTILIDVRAKTARFTMTVNANRDRATAKGVVNAFLKTVRGDDNALIVDALMARRSNNVSVSMKDIINSSGSKLYSKCQDRPRQFRITKTVDFHQGTFNSPRNTFPETLFGGLKKYYETVGQHLTNWEASAPRIAPDSQAVAVTNDEPGAANSDNGTGTT